MVFKSLEYNFRVLMPAPLIMLLSIPLWNLLQLN